MKKVKKPYTKIAVLKVKYPPLVERLGLCQGTT